MLDFLRQRAGSWMVKALLAAIIIVFIFWGVGTFRTRQANLLAEVNGKPITLTEYQTLYAQKLRQLQNLLGPHFNEELLKQLQLPAQVFEELVRKRLLAQVAKEMGVSVAPKEIQLAIAQMPVFQTNGRFDPQRYQLVLRSLHLNPADFEEMVRTDLLEAKVRHLFTAPILATDNEVKEWFNFQHEQLKLAYVKIPIDTCLKEVKISEKELKEYYEKNKEKYRTPLKIAITYYLLSFDKLKKELNISEEDIKNYYTSHKEEFTVPEKRKLRHILIAKKKGESEEELLKRAQEIRQKIKDAKNFAEIARKYSDDPHSKEEGGDLGWVTANELFESLREVVFSAKKGEIIGPLRSPLGYHIILVEKIKPARTKSLAEVKEEIRKKLVAQRLKTYAWDKANQIYDEIILLGGLTEWAKKNHVSLKTTPLFDPEHPPADLPPEVVKAALKLEEGELGPIVETPDGLIIFKLARREEPKIPPFEKVKEKVAQDLSRAKALELCGQRAQKILKALATSKDPQKILQKEGLSLAQTPYFARVEGENAGLPPEVLRVVRGFARQGQWYEEPILAGEAYYLIKLLEIKPPKEEEFVRQKETLKEELTARKRQEAFSAWYRHLRANAEVKLYRELPKF
ncbi:MAG TPA: hypothetical protein ENJ96_04805 [Thermodesulfatator atlanticus]|uniref:Periplasmic chaperone PpiD n=1 Tax=Thermodesulfatator atlanticus TaxID=501497 RepID=A0A7V5NZK4_9BACT|nr:hypothetical protein [Thermodesulfatator atlanticus]